MCELEKEVNEVRYILPGDSQKCPTFCFIIEGA